MRWSGPIEGVASCFTDVHPGPDPGEERIVVDRFGEPAGLVGGQRVHRVEDQGFDALFVLGGGAGAVIEHRIQEAFGFARSGAGCDDRRFGVAVEGGEAFERCCLMGVGHEIVGQPAEWRRPLLPCRFKRCFHPQVRAAEDPVAALQEVGQCVAYVVIGQRERGRQVLDERSPNLTGNKGWDHRKRPAQPPALGADLVF